MLDVNRRYPTGTRLSDRTTARAVAWTNVGLGAWVLLTPFAAARPFFYFWSHLIAGALAALASFSVFRATPVQGIVSGLAGTWLAVSAFIPGLLAGPALFWNNLAVGILLLAGAFSALTRRRPAGPL